VVQERRWYSEKTHFFFEYCIFHFDKLFAELLYAHKKLSISAHTHNTRVYFNERTARNKTARHKKAIDKALQSRHCIAHAVYLFPYPVLAMARRTRVQIAPERIP
jgi:hypothetical protein